MKTSRTLSAELNLRATVSDLKGFLSQAPDEATVSITHTKGDRPFDADSTTITLRWSE